MSSFRIAQLYVTLAPRIESSGNHRLALRNISWEEANFGNFPRFLRDTA